MRFGVPAHPKGGMQRPRESAPRGQGGGGERRGGGPRPALECIFPWSFLLADLWRGLLLFFVFPLSFLTVGGVGGPL